jgi:hypothetical protein
VKLLQVHSEVTEDFAAAIFFLSIVGIVYRADREDRGLGKRKGKSSYLP